MSELWQPWENLFLHDVCKTMPLHIIAEKLERTGTRHSNSGIAYWCTTTISNDRQTMDAS